MDSIGVRLKREREKRKISLDEVAAATKISNRFLSAIEADHFDQLPGGIFNRGFIRSYARHLGLDEDQIIAEYKATTGEEDPNVPVETDIRQDLPSLSGANGGDLPWKELVIILLLVAVGLGIWRFRSREALKGKRAALTAASSQAASAASPTTIYQRPLGGLTLTTVGKSSPQSAANQNLQPFQLRVVARENSWISISGVEGELLHQTLTPPEEKSFHATKRIVVKVGNAAAIGFIWNGQDIPPQGKEGEVKTFIFDSAGMHEPPPVATP